MGDLAGSWRHAAAAAGFASSARCSDVPQDRTETGLAAVLPLAGRIGPFGALAGRDLAARKPASFDLAVIFETKKFQKCFDGGESRGTI